MAESVQVPMTLATYDIRVALRGLRRSPLFAIVAILSLALGIGANTAIFTLIDQILLRKLPVKDPDAAGDALPAAAPITAATWARGCTPIRSIRTTAEGAEPLAEVLCRRLVAASISVDNQTERVERGDGVRATSSRCSACSRRSGRVFNSAEDDQVYSGPSRRRAQLRLLGHALRRAIRPSIGKKILVNNYPMTIVGVSAQGFAGLDPARSRRRSACRS